MEVYRLLNEDGSLDDKHRDILPDDDLIKILKTMIFNRVFDTRMLMLQRQGRLGFYLTSTGEEAITIGSAYCLNDNDPVFISYRELGSLLWRGVPHSLIVNQLIGNDQDRSKGRQMPVHYCFREYDIPSVSSPVGTQISHACGAAYGYSLQGTGQISLAFLGEGTASTGEFHSGINFSGTLNAPVIIVLRNNGYAISTPESKQSAATCLASRAEGYGVVGRLVDGNDLIAVVSAVQEAAERARSGGGPTLLEMLTYRMGGHSSSDEPSRYRSSEEEEDWKKVDSLLRVERHAKWRGIWTDEQAQEEKEASDKEITTLLKNCAPFPPPPVHTLFEDVYGAMPEHLERQKNEYLSLLKKWEESQ